LGSLFAVHRIHVEKDRINAALAAAGQNFSLLLRGAFVCFIADAETISTPITLTELSSV